MLKDERILYKEDLQDIESYEFVKVEILENEVNICVNVFNTLYNKFMFYKVGRIIRYTDLGTNENYYSVQSFIDGKFKEYKTIKPLLNVIVKRYENMSNIDEILIWAGLKKDITTTRKYKKLLAENEAKQTEPIEEIKENEVIEESAIETIEIKNSQQINDIIKSAMITKLFTYENVAEYNNFKMIAGYETRINYEGKEVNEAMHVIIYNTSTNDIIYQTGSNTRMDKDILIHYAETLLKIVEKYINDRWNLNKSMDQFFIDFRFIIFDRIKKQYELEAMELKKQIEDTAINNENTELENKLIDICTNKELKLIKSYTRMYIINFKDKRCNKTISSIDTIEAIINDNRYENQYKLIYSNVNTCNLKDYNIALKEAIKIIA